MFASTTYVGETKTEPEGESDKAKGHDGHKEENLLVLVPLGSLHLLVALWAQNTCSVRLWFSMDATLPVSNVDVTFAADKAFWVPVVLPNCECLPVQQR